MLSEGAIVDRYRVEVPIGSGGMGHVYRAIDLRLRRPVALKVLHDKISPAAMTRLVREARLAGALNHPNIVGVFDVGEHEGVAFMAMELVEGTQLKRIVWQKVMMEQRIRWLVDVARGLDAAHRAGVVHRDVKPQNVMVTAAAAKVLDFGVAKEAAARSPQTALLPSLRTQPGHAVGTPYYMAPEVLRGDNASDELSDQFSWGLVAYELVVGKLPTRDDLDSGGKWVAPKIVLPEVSERVAQVIHRTLDDDRSARFSSMTDVAAALEASLSPLPRTVEQNKRPHTIIDGGGAAQPTMLFPVMTPEMLKDETRKSVPAPASISEKPIRDPKRVALTPLVEAARAVAGRCKEALVIVTLDLEGNRARFFVQIVVTDDKGNLSAPEAPMDVVQAAAKTIADDARDGNGRWQRLVVRLAKNDVSVVQVA